MLKAYRLREGALDHLVVPPEGPVPEDAIWLDLVGPTEAEERLLERALSVSIPTREEIMEIEPSSRLYVEDGARFMTGSVVCNAEGEAPSLAAIGFILVRGRLVTVRYDEPKPFKLLIAKLSRVCPADIGGTVILFELLDTIIDRAADIIEQLGTGIDNAAREIFDPGTRRTDANQRYRGILKVIGRKGDLASKVRESLVSIARIVTFLAGEAGLETQSLTKEQKASLKSMQRDVSSLSDHVSFLASKLTFLLDATLGLVGIEQNNIIKIFAVLSVVLMPPTLIASIYGMNFQHMPELANQWGYPLALLAMLVAAIVPYWFFKWKRWL